MYKTDVYYFSKVRYLRIVLQRYEVSMRIAFWISVILAGGTFWLTTSLGAKAGQGLQQESGLNHPLTSVVSLGLIEGSNKQISSLHRRQLLNTHNRRRAEVGSPRMFWSEDLAKYAQDWADQLAREGGGLRHRPNVVYGENIYAIYGGQANGRQVVNNWATEARYFVNGVFPNVSTTGNWVDVGHYSQVVWASTTQVGCGMAQTGNQQIWVCNYNPPGNFSGIRPLDR